MKKFIFILTSLLIIPYISQAGSFTIITTSEEEVLLDILIVNLNKVKPLDNQFSNKDDMVKDIVKNSFKILSGIIDEESIEKRWTSLTQRQRTGILIMLGIYE